MKASNKIGFAVVGLGRIAHSSVLPCFAHTKKARLVALVGREQKVAARLGRKYHVPAVYAESDFAACLANPDVAAVYIATPQDSHLAYTVMAARAGKHVLCEKPLAITARQSAQMVDACRRNGVLLMTAYRKHFEPSCLYVKRLIHSGALGRVDMIHAGFSELHVPGASPPWLLDPAVAGGGPLMDLGVYCINTTRWLAEEDPVEVTHATASTRDKQRFRHIEQAITFRLRFASGLIVNASTSYGAAMCSFVLIQGAKGWACLSPAFDFAEECHLTGKIGGRWFEKTFPLIDEFAPEVDALASAIQRRRPVAPDGVQGHRDMIIAAAIYAAAGKRGPVSIRYT
jgi:predicted dehydrogenase